MRHLIELVLFKAYAELKADAGRYYAGFLWWFVEPIFYMGAFYLVFGLVFQRGGEHFVPFLLCGLIVWKWFASTVSQGANSILAHVELIRRVYVQKMVFPGAAVLSNTVKFLVVFFLFLLFLWIYGLPPNAAWLALPTLLITQFLLNAGCSFLFSAVVPLLPDIRIFIDKLLLVGLFISGIFFNLEKVPEGFRLYLQLNPMAVLIRSYREVLLNGRWPDWNSLIFVTVFSLTVICIARWIMIRSDRIYPKVLV